MSSFLGGLWSNTFGLLVEDGSLAIGIVVTLALTAVIASVAERPDLAGWMLLLGLIMLLVVNVYRAGLRARRAVTDAGTVRP